VETTRVIVSGGVHLSAEVAGSPDAPPMVLLHALGQRGSHWAPVLPRLSDRFRVYAPDLRGHGDSDWPGTYSFQLMRADIAGMLDQLDLGRVTLIGHSMGAGVA
jgi:pimeloyl-ACP methyl ester carboxylesterase